jgi:hypothetical protein
MVATFRIKREWRSGESDEELIWLHCTNDQDIEAIQAVLGVEVTGFEGMPFGRESSAGWKVKLLRIEAGRPEWRVARYAAILALNPTMRCCELKGLRWRDVNLLD